MPGLIDGRVLVQALVACASVFTHPDVVSMLADLQPPCALDTGTRTVHARALTMWRLDRRVAVIQQAAAVAVQSAWRRAKCARWYVNVNELRLGFSNTNRNPEGILSHNNRKS